MTRTPAGRMPASDIPESRIRANDPKSLPGIPVLFENDDILAVNKPEGIVSTPAPGGGLPEFIRAGHAEKLYPVHRLDKDVSGVILFAKNADAHRRLNGEFERRAVKKTYVALTHGVIAKNRGIINAPIREFGSGRMGVDPKTGKPSVTEFKVEERFGAFTLVRAFPLTGRRHQIRVHFYHIGHPVVGDLRYGDRAGQKTFPRLMLHALAVELPTPSGARLTIEAPLPESFCAVVEDLKEGASRRGAAVRPAQERR